MKDRNKILFLFAFFICILFLQSCGKKNNLVTIDYPNTYYVSENNTKFGYQFAYDNKINSFEIKSFNTYSKKKYSYEFVKEENENGKQMMIKNYYIYGIVFDFGFEDDYFESFDIMINDEISKTIKLNMRINIVDSVVDGDILPLSIPFIGDISKEIEWVILPLKDINIKSIDVINSQNSNNSILINSLEHSVERCYSSKEKIFINVNFEYDENVLFDYMYLSITYVDSNNEEKIFNTDISFFGDSLEALRCKIC